MQLLNLMALTGLVQAQDSASEWTTSLQSLCKQMSGMVSAINDDAISLRDICLISVSDLLIYCVVARLFDRQDLRRIHDRLLSPSKSSGKHLCQGHAINVNLIDVLIMCFDESDLC